MAMLIVRMQMRVSMEVKRIYPIPKIEEANCTSNNPFVKGKQETPKPT
jgi:hypothetical protein